MFYAILGVLLYFTPSIVAVTRNFSGGTKLPHFGQVIVVNVFFGWTFIGWVIALMKAVASKVTYVAVVPSTPANGVRG